MNLTEETTAVDASRGHTTRPAPDSNSHAPERGAHIAPPFVMRLIDFFDRGAALAPDRICLKDDSVSISYRDTAALTHRIARRLIDAGAQPGTRMAIHAANGAHAFACVLGILRAGGVWLPIHGRNPVDENIRFLRDNGCQALFFDRRFTETARRIIDAMPELVAAVCVDGHTDFAPSLERWLGDTSSAPVDVARDPGEVTIIKATGGTTGRPKSVMISHRNMGTMIANFLALMPHDVPPVNLVAVPMTHGAGNIAIALLTLGATLVFLERADPERILQSIERERVTTLFLPPTVIYSLLARDDARGRDYASLRYFIYSAAPMSAEKLREAVEVFGPVMTQAYGQTEAPLLCTFMSPSEHLIDDEAALRKRLLSCGRPTPFTRVAVMDDRGKLLGDDEVGEIVVRGDIVMLGYLDNPAENEHVSRFGWHHTGDVGYRDAQGWYYIVDRKKDMIISGGFNIYPSEIEQVLWSHPAVQDCAVIGVPDDKWGEAVTAIVELKRGADASEGEVLEYCRVRLGGMKTPKAVQFWNELPRSAVGKVLKRDIRDKFWQGRDRQV